MWSGHLIDAAAIISHNERRLASRAGSGSAVLNEGDLKPIDLNCEPTRPDRIDLGSQTEILIRGSTRS